MATYLITGALGAGKGLFAAKMVRDYMMRGCRVATNMDIDMEWMCKPENDYSRVIRLPDHPIADDLWGIGRGFEDGPYDEKRFGAMVLDELATFLNTRGYNDPSRKGILDYLMHARKQRWDLFMTIQDFQSLDKQLRGPFAEHIVYLSRLDRKQIMGMNAPKIHSAVVKYGRHPRSPTAFTDTFRATDIYPCYDTEQVFVEREYHESKTEVVTTNFHGVKKTEKRPLYLGNGPYTYLPRKYLKATRPKPADNLIMRMTKIYFRRTSRAMLLAVGVFIGAYGYSFYQGETVPLEDFQSLARQHEELRSKPAPKVSSSSSASQSIVNEDSFRPNKLKISSYRSMPGQKPVYTFKDEEGELYSISDVKSHGYDVIAHGRNLAVIFDQTSKYEVHQ